MKSRPGTSTSSSVAKRGFAITHTHTHTNRPADLAERFTDLYRRHHADLRRYAWHLSVPGLDPDDIVADVWLVAWRRRERILSVPEPRLWLRAAARFVAARHRRSKIRHDRLLLRLAGLVQPCSPDLDARSVRERLVAVLSPTDVMLLDLSAIGFGIDEMAAHFGLTRDAARSRLYRARAKARRIVGYDGS